ncbi:hypothetical protein [Gemmata sp.]|uniref:hypothetical protein n=1 Tax=Gemmata sp. TaxID=1914242 RepID=UPI003F70E7ED
MSNQPQRNISPDREILYYAGMVLTAVGVLLFFSVFVTGCMNFGNFDHFEERARGEMARALGGMVLMAIGQGMRALGVAGLAGSGVVLDPQKARKDLEPWSRSAGGMLADALDETGLAKQTDTPAPPPVVKVRCRGCAALNDEHAKFCNQCGQPV